MYARYVNKWMDVYECVWGLEHAWGHLGMYSGLCYRDSDMQKCEDLCSCQNMLLNVVFSVGIFVCTCMWTWGIECESVKCFHGCMYAVGILCLCY